MASGTNRRRRSMSTTSKQYPRTARLNELVREIVADELERIDDDRLQLVTITAADVAADLRHARVLFDSLDGAARDAEILDALRELRVRLQSAIGRQARIKRVPELAFAPDPAVREGEHIDSILRTIEPDEPDEPDETIEPDEPDVPDEPIGRGDPDAGPDDTA